MPDQVRINELARELEIKAKVLIEYLPAVGVTEKKTHSSSIDHDHAEAVRRHFQQSAEPGSVAAPPPVEAAPAPKPPPAPPRAEPVAAAPAPPTAAAAPPVHPVAQPVVPHVPVARPAAQHVAPSAPPHAAASAHASSHPATPSAAPAARIASTPPARPSVPAQHVPAARAAAPQSTAPRHSHPVAATPKTAPLHATHATGATRSPAAAGAPRPAVAPGGFRSTAQLRPSAAAQAKPAAATTIRPAPRPAPPPPRLPSRGPMPTQMYSPKRQTHPTGANARSFSQGSARPATLGTRPAGSPAGPPPRPGAPPSRFPQRPGTRPLSPRPGQSAKPGTPASGPPKAEPGKPLYARKPAARARPQMDKRYAEGERKLHPVRSRSGLGERRTGHVVVAPAPVREPRQITVTEGITVRELAEKLDIRAKELLKTLLDRGIFASINQALDVPTATSLSEAFNGIVQVVSFEEKLVQEEISSDEHPGVKVPRSPVVTVMGHVDHGKTSLLDAIRETEVAAGESGGITQHIGAYQVETKGRKIVFIDTPGHEAFTRMRARGAKVTDIVVLVVGADDGVMPQTEEAIAHARAANVPIIVAINKVDLPDAQPERVKRQLADRGLMPEDWGGDTVMVEVSARTRQNLDHLLDMILLVGDLRELKASPESFASGTVLESRVDKGRGPVATVLVQNGTLHVGDVFICGAVYGKVRAMFDDRGRPAKIAGPSTPIEVLGLQGVPDAGDQFQVADEAKARHIVEYRQGKQREAALAKSSTSRLTLDQLHEQLRAGEVKELPIVIKADVQGSAEVLSEMLPKLDTEQVKLKIIQASVGAISETDVILASASGAVVIGFNVRPERKAAELAQREGVDIRLHTIIYELTDQLKKAMTGLLAPVVKEISMGRAEVRDTFRIKGVGMIAGCSIVDGLVKRDADVRVLRDNVVIYTGKIASLRRFKEDAVEVRAGFECGIVITNFSDEKVGDILECFRIERVAAVPVSA